MYFEENVYLTGLDFNLYLNSFAFILLPIYNLPQSRSSHNTMERYLLCDMLWVLRIITSVKFYLDFCITFLFLSIFKDNSDRYTVMCPFLPWRMFSNVIFKENRRLLTTYCFGRSRIVANLCGGALGGVFRWASYFM